MGLINVTSIIKHILCFKKENLPLKYLLLGEMSNALLQTAVVTAAERNAN